MSGSVPPNGTYRSVGEGNGDGVWPSAAGGDTHRECELCQSETDTTLEYGMTVCPACSRTYLP